jgi:hypothetical protein
MGNPAALQLTTPRSVNVWIRFNGYVGDEIVLGKTSNIYNTQWGITIGWNGQQIADRMCGTPTTSSYGDNNWHMVTEVHSPTGISNLYVDGVLQVISSGCVASMGSNNFRIGVAADGTGNFTGLIAAAHIYSRALSASEIVAMYAGGK